MINQLNRALINLSFYLLNKKNFFIIGYKKNLKKLGLVAQWTRALGYEPRCRGFESLLAQT